MKRKLLTLLLLIASVFGIFAIANNNSKEAEAAYNFTGHIYFERPSNWTQSKVVLMVGHSGWSAGYEMKKVGDTNIYYYAYTSESWGGATEFAFFDISSVWGGEGNSISHRSAYAVHSSRIIKEAEWKADNSKNHYLFANEAGSNAWANPATDLNVNIKVSASTGGTVSATAYKFTGTNAAALDTSSTSIDVIKYTDATLTATASEGYKFVGWYENANFTGTAISTDASYTVDNVVDEKTYYAKFELSVPTSTVISKYYNNGVYTRTTHIHINKGSISSDFATHFHNPQGGDNVLLDRTTEFVDDYLYFVETKVGFGTNANGKLTSFTWNGSYQNSAHETNAIEEAFYTLYDLMNADAEWTYAGGKYTTTDATVIKIAEGFTAPGWQSPTAAYTDYTQVVVYELNGQLYVELYVSATNSGIVTSTPVGNHALFSQAIIG